MTTFVYAFFFAQTMFVLIMLLQALILWKDLDNKKKDITVEVVLVYVLNCVAAGVLITTYLLFKFFTGS